MPEKISTNNEAKEIPGALTMAEAFPTACDQNVVSAASTREEEGGSGGSCDGDAPAPPVDPESDLLRREPTDPVHTRCLDQKEAELPEEAGEAVMKFKEESGENKDRAGDPKQANDDEKKMLLSNKTVGNIDTVEKARITAESEHTDVVKDVVNEQSTAVIIAEDAAVDPVHTVRLDQKEGELPEEAREAVMAFKEERKLLGTEENKNQDQKAEQSRAGDSEQAHDKNMLLAQSDDSEQALDTTMLLVYDTVGKLHAVDRACIPAESKHTDICEEVLHRPATVVIRAQDATAAVPGAGTMEDS